MTILMVQTLGGTSWARNSRQYHEFGWHGIPTSRCRWPMASLFRPSTFHPTWSHRQEAEGTRPSNTTSWRKHAKILRIRIISIRLSAWISLWPYDIWYILKRYQHQKPLKTTSPLQKFSKRPARWAFRQQALLRPQKLEQMPAPKQGCQQS